MSVETVPRDEPLVPADWPATGERRYAELQRQLAETHGVDATSHVTETDSGGIHYLAAGPTDGEPLLLLHGLSTAGATWLPMVGSLTDTYRVLMPDRPGRGLSAVTEYPAAVRPFMTAYLADMLDNLAIERPHVVGNSLGGLQAFLLALDHDRADRLCLVGAPGGVSREFPLPFRLLTVGGINRVLFWLSSRDSSPESAREDIEQVGVSDGSALSELFCELSYVAQELPGRRKSLLSFSNAVGSFGRMHPMYDLTDELTGLDRLTAFIWGSEDYFFDPAVGRPVAEAMPDAEFHLLDAHGHMPWLEPGEEVERLVRRFLDGK